MPLTFERDMEFEYGEASTLSPLVRRMVAQNPGPFTYLGTNTYIVGHGEVAVIDPGPDDDVHLAALFKALDGETVTHIIVTHTHRDHSPLAAKLKQTTGAPTHGYGPHGAGSGERSGNIRLDASGDMDFVPDHALGHGDIIKGSGWSLEAVFTPGHTANHLAFALAEEQTLFSGDHVMGWSTSVIAPPDGNMGVYLKSLQLLLERDEAVYWPGHGPGITKPRALVRGFIGHRKAREASILRRLDEGDRTIAEIVPRIYADIDLALHPAAAMSVFAHIELLIERGEVETDGPATINSEYQLTD